MNMADDNYGFYCGNPDSLIPPAGRGYFKSQGRTAQSAVLPWGAISEVIIEIPVDKRWFLPRRGAGGIRTQCRHRVSVFVNAPVYISFFV